MTAIVFNIAKGRAAYYAGLPAANDALIAIPLESSGLVTDSVMRDYPTLAALLAGASNEQTAMGRKTITTVTVTTDNTNDRVDVDTPDLTWAAATGNPIGAIIICYCPDAGASTDADLIPLTKHSATGTPDGTDLNIVIPSGGFYRAT